MAKTKPSAAAPPPPPPPPPHGGDDDITVITETVVYKGGKAVHHFSSKSDVSAITLDDYSKRQFDTGVFELKNTAGAVVGMLWVVQGPDPNDSASRIERWALGAGYQWPKTGAGTVDRTYTYHPTTLSAPGDDLAFKKLALAALGANVTFVRADCKSF